MQRAKPANNYTRMALEPIPKVILTMAVPTILAMLVQSVYSMADTYFVGQLKPELLATQSTAAVTLVGPLFILIQAIGLALGMGGSSYLSRLLGRGDRESADNVLATCFYTAALLGVGMMLLGEAFMQPLMRLMGATDELVPLASQYASVLLIGAPIMCCCFVMNNGLRAEGSVIFSTIGITSGALLNIVLDPICIFTFGWGVKGAAIATVFSQLVSMLILLSFYVFKKSALSLHPRYFMPKADIYSQVLRIGVPTFMRNVLGSLSALLINHVAIGFGQVVLAGMGVVGRFSWVVFSVLLGFAMAYMPVAGYNYGARRYTRVREAFTFSRIVCVSFMSVSAVLILLFADPIAHMLHSDVAVADFATRVLRAQALTFPLIAWGVLTNMLFEALGHALPATILSLGRQGLFLMLSVAVLPPLFGLGGLVFSQPVADLLFFLLALPMSLSITRKLKRMQDDPVPLDSVPEPVLAE